MAEGLNMEKILWLAHTESDGSLGKAAREALTGALDLAGRLGAGLCVGLVGREVQAAADGIGGCGAERFLGVEGEAFSVPRYSTDALAMELLVREAGATLVVAPGISRFARGLPGVAERIGGRIDSRIVGVTVVDGAPVVERWFYRQRMMASLSRQGRPWFILLEAGVLDPWKGSADQVTLESLQTEPPETLRTQVTGVEGASAGAQTIRPDAEVLLVAGAGWTKVQSDGKTHVKQAERLILDFLEKTQASLGSSKSLVDQSTEGQDVLSFMTHMNQVGQTGSTPRHPKGLATCCHGEEPHVVGWRFIKERRAVNTDAGCGWARGKADVLYVADAFELMERVNQLLEDA